MNNTYSFELDYTTLVVFISVIVTLLLQILLCFKSKKMWVKILPAMLLVLSAIVFSICSARIGGWDAFGYLFFAFLSLGLIIVCGIGWIIWAIVRKRNK
ncbi:MAG: hypothetical protein IKB80_02845 [Oscillospiraceae bacterium]|nr:hypothetical protein [Oscillospiraceae bacterium]